MTTNRSRRCSTNNVRPSNLVSLPLHNINNPRSTSFASYNVPMMTGYYSGGDLPRSPHTPRTKGIAIRYNPIYYLRSILLSRLLLGLLPLKPGPNTRAGRVLTPYGDHHTRPLWSPPSQYSRTISIRRNSHMSPPQHYRGRTKTSHPIPRTYYFAWAIFYCPSSHWVLWSTLHHCWWGVRFYILCSHRVSWTTCYYWIQFPCRVPPPPDPISFYIRTSLRLWSRRLILTLCRRSVTIPLRVHLLMRLISS